MNEQQEKILKNLFAIRSEGLSSDQALMLMLVGEMTRMNDSLEYLKRAAGNIDDTLTQIGQNL